VTTHTDTNITGKVVVITGASSGLGEATARYLAERGATVVLGARRVERLQTLVDEITRAGGRRPHVPPTSPTPRRFKRSSTPPSSSTAAST
jgi:NAD(P)-dependent dehydrogenase (short-subunit alcohol dehydrogenase family)